MGIDPGPTTAPLDVPSAGKKSYIIYGFRDKVTKEIQYVGKASGVGNPIQVMKKRISRGHDHWDADKLEYVILDTQKTRLTNAGAEDIYVTGYRERGANLTNKQEALDFSREPRRTKSLRKVNAYLRELLERQHGD